MIPGARRQFVLALAAIALAQVAYWFLVAPLLFSYPPIGNTLPVESIEVATLDRPEFAQIAAAARKRIEPGEHQCCGPGYRAFIFTLRLDSVPEDGLAYANNVGADNILVYVNGSLVRGEGRMTLPDITYHNNLRRILHLPSGLLRQGSNEIVNIVVRDFNPWFDVFRPLLGPYTRLSADLARRSFMLIEYRLISITIGIVLAILALVVSLRREQRRIGLWMVLLLVAWTLRALYYAWAESPLHGADRLTYYFLVTAILPLAWVNLINEWTADPWRRLRWASIAAFALAAMAIVRALHTLDAQSAYDHSALIVNALGLGCVAAAVARLLRHLWVSPVDRPWERALLLLCLALLGAESTQELFFQVTNGQSQTSLPLLMIVFAMAFARGNARLLRLAHEFGSMLGAQLRQREAELAEAHRRETELVRRETLAGERRRLMLDMHDGVVGQLVGLQHAARGSALSAADVADGIAGVIDELRLIIDSLDHAGTNFSNALAGFRARIEPRLEAIGIRSRWRNDLPLEQATCDPGVVVQALRILQEAITNAIKYAKTAELDVACRLDDPVTGRIVLQVRDYGSGLPAEAPAGRGLGNMQERARSLGGALEISNGEPGTKLVLHIPGTASPPSFP